MKLKTIYSRPRIDKLLERGSFYPLVSVVAGAGYGKTTAMSEYLKNSTLPYALITLTDGDAELLWEKLCTAVALHSAKVADTLRVLGLPVGAWQVARAVRLVQTYCERPFIVCIDDYQFLPENSPIHKLVETLAFEAVPNLHIFLLSRIQPNIRLYTLVSKELAVCIDAETLAFDMKETDGYLVMRGLRLTKGAVEQIYKASEGWISAIYLLGEGVRAGGEIGHGKNIDELFYENYIKPMPEKDRELLYRLSAFDSFPLDMAVCALGTEKVRELIGTLLRENAFINKDANEEYCFHPLLREYLRARCPHDSEQKEVFRRAGMWYIRCENRGYAFSVELLKKGDCVEEMLALYNRHGARRMNYCDRKAICAMAMGLPEELCEKYPFPYMQIIFYMLLSGVKRNKLFAQRLFNRLRTYYTEHDGPERDIILGELIVISRVTGYGQLEVEGDPLVEAARLLGGRPSEYLDPNDPFTFGLPMLLQTEYMSAGTLDDTVARCQNNTYELVTDGFGRGSEPLVRAEASLLRCELEDAKRFAEQSILEAEEKSQRFVIGSARSTLMRRALFLGDIDGAAEQLQCLRELVSDAAGGLKDYRITMPVLREVLTLAECFFNTTLQRKSELPPELLDGSYKTLMAAGLGVPQMYEARAMYVTGDTARALRLCDRLSELPNVCEIARIDCLLLTALCRERLERTSSALPLLAEALLEAQQDGVVLPFAENAAVLPLLNKLKSVDGLDRSFLAKVKHWCGEYKATVPAAEGEAELKLSVRELEVLRLTARGKTRAEIAAVSHVQENTIKAQLSSVYRKLGARNKTEAINIARSYGII